MITLSVLPYCGFNLTDITNTFSTFAASLNVNDDVPGLLYATLFRDTVESTCTLRTSS